MRLRAACGSASIAARMRSRSIPTKTGRRWRRASTNEAPAETQIAVRQDIWAKRLPKDQDELWNFVKELSEADRMLLLAHCACRSA